MLLVKRNPDLMPTLFNELMNWDNWNNCSSDAQGTMPKMNVSESNEDYEIELCVPGLSKEDLNLSIDSEDNLVIEMVEGEKKEEKKEGRHFLRHRSAAIQATAPHARERQARRHQRHRHQRHPAHRPAQVYRG